MALHPKETIYDIAYKGDIFTIKLKLEQDNKLLTQKDEVSIVKFPYRFG